MVLPKLDLKEDIEKYDALAEKLDVKFVQCDHKGALINDTRTALVCKCGVAWGGQRLGELKELLDKQN